MEACGCFGVTEDEYGTILQLFKEASPQRPYSARGPYAQLSHRVCYLLFCEVVQPSGEPRPPMTEGLADLIAMMPPTSPVPRLR